MRKRFISPALETVQSHTEGWLDVEREATVEITSEEKDFPVESAFASEGLKAGVPQRRGRRRFGSCLTGHTG
jgi:hypothetical protein